MFADLLRFAVLCAVVLILKFADDLLDGVLDGDHAGDAAVFVHHDCDMLPGTLHFVEQVINRLRFRNKHRIADDAFHIAGHRIRIKGRGAYGILEVGHTDQIVNVVADDRDPGEPGSGTQLQEILKILPAFDADHIGARHHDFAGQRLRQGQYIAQHLGDLRVEIIGFDQPIDGCAPLFELQLLQFLVVGQLGLLMMMPFIDFVAADLGKRGQRHSQSHDTHVPEHDIDRFDGTRGTRTDKDGDHADKHARHDAADQLHPQHTAAQRHDARHQHAVEHVAHDTEEST